MRSVSSITATSSQKQKAKGERRRLRICLVISFVLLPFAIPSFSQSVAILTPDAAAIPGFTSKLSDDLSTRLDVLDSSLVVAAYNATKHSDPYNMTSDESKTAGSAIGCDFLLLVKTGNQRRASFERPEYYESFAAIYVVSSRTGRLVYWTLRNAEEGSQTAADSKLLSAVPAIARGLAATIKEAQKREIVEPRPDNIEEPPNPGTPEAKGFVAPIPYRRIKPEYTTTAYLYSVTATVEVLVDLDASGNITRTEIVRWAGFGLDESVEKAVRTMNWRPAERNKKTLPMRVLLRYNFKKTEAKP